MFRSTLVKHFHAYVTYVIFPCLMSFLAVAKKEAYGDTELLNRLPYRQIRPKLHVQKSLDIRGSLGSHKLKSSKKLNSIFAFWLIS